MRSSDLQRQARFANLPRERALLDIIHTLTQQTRWLRARVLLLELRVSKLDSQTPTPSPYPKLQTPAALADQFDDDPSGG